MQLPRFWNKIIRVLLALCIILAVSAVGFLAGEYFYYQNRILPGFYIGQIKIGGLTRPEILNLLRSKNPDQLLTSPLYLSFKNFKFTFLPSSIIKNLKVEEMTEAAFKISGEENYFKNLILLISREKKMIPIIAELDENKIISLINQSKKEIEGAPKNPYYKVYLSGSVEVIPAQDGRKVDTAQTLTEVQKSVARNQPEVKLQIIYSPPQLQTQQLAQHLPLYLMGTFKTYYGTHDSPNRIHNIMLIASKLNNTVVTPNETLSLLKQIGKFTSMEGFREAYVITKEGLEAQYGGGACQIGTTLFNAVSFAGLKVIERRNHSLYFSIYPLGRDATIYPPYTDFKFINDSGRNIIIQGLADKKGLVFNILGVPTGKKITFSAPAVKYAYKKISDEASGEIKEAKTRSFQTKVIMTTEKEGKIIEEKIYKSFYKLHGDKDKVKIIKKEVYR